MSKKGSIKTPDELIEQYVQKSVETSIKEQPATNIQDLAATYNAMKKTNNDIELNRMVISAWAKEKKEERNQKGKYIDLLAKVFIYTLITLFIVFICIGLGWLKYENETLKMFLTCVYIEIITAFIYILKELFKNSSKDLLKFLKEFNEKDNKN